MRGKAGRLLRRRERDRIARAIRLRKGKAAHLVRHGEFPVSIGIRDGHEDIRARMRRLQRIGVRQPAIRLQAQFCVRLLRCQVGAVEQTLGGQRRAASRAASHGSDAWLVQGGIRGIVEQGAPRRIHHHAALAHGVRVRWLGLDLRLAGGHPADQSLGILFRRQQGRAGAVGNARRYRDGVLRRQAHDVRTAVAGQYAVALVQHVIRHLDGLQGDLAPVLLRILLRVRVLEGNAVRVGASPGQPVGVAQVRREERVLAGGHPARAHAVLQVDAVVLEHVQARTGTLVRIRDGAALFQAPFAGTADGAVDSARAARRARDDAGAVRVEAGRHLHHQGDVLLARAIVRIGDVFAARHQALPRADIAGCIHVGAVQGAIAAVGGDVEHGAVIGVDGVAAQLGRRRLLSIRIRGRGARQPRLAQAGRQQVIALAVVVGPRDGAQVVGQLVQFFRRMVAAAAGQQQQGAQARAVGRAHDRRLHGGSLR